MVKPGSISSVFEVVWVYLTVFSCHRIFYTIQLTQLCFKFKFDACFILLLMRPLCFIINPFFCRQSERQLLSTSSSGTVSWWNKLVCVETPGHSSLECKFFLYILWNLFHLFTWGHTISTYIDYLIKPVLSFSYFSVGFRLLFLHVKFNNYSSYW